MVNREMQAHETTDARGPDMRVTARGITPLGSPEGPWTAVEFAAGLATRYGTGSGFVPLPERTLRAGRPFHVARHVHSHSLFQLIPQLALTLHHTTMAPFRPSPGNVQQVTHTKFLEQACLERQTGETRIHDLTERLVTRTLRISTVETRHERSAGQTIPRRAFRIPGLEIEAVPPTSRVLRSQPSVNRQAAAADGPATVGKPVEGASLSPTPMAKHESAAPVDINRLTDQVVAAIDRRILAHRERFGRI